jgi:excisionase family DNA binding protein
MFYPGSLTSEDLTGTDVMAEGSAKAKEACEFLGVKKSKLYSLAAEQRVPHIRIDGSLSFPRVALKIFAMKG